MESGKPSKKGELYLSVIAFVTILLLVIFSYFMLSKGSSNDVSVASGPTLNLKLVTNIALPAKVADIFEISITPGNLDQNLKLGAAEVKVSFDNQVLEALSLTEGTNILGLSKTLDNTNGKLSIDLAKVGEGNFTDNAEILRIKFKVKQVSPSTNIKLSTESTFGLPNALNYTGSISDLKVTLSAPQTNDPGLICKADYNKNGMVDISDFRTFAKYYKFVGASCTYNLTGSDCYLDSDDLAIFALGYKLPSYCAGVVSGGVGSTNPGGSASSGGGGSTNSQGGGTTSGNANTNPTFSTVVPPTTNGYAIRSDGVILKNGKPFFPFGFYYEAEVNMRYWNLMAADYETIGKAGFNLVVGGVTGPDNEKDTEAARLKAKELGISIIASYYKPSYKLWLDRLKTDTTIMGWNTNDDFNSPYSSPKANPTQALDEPNRIDSYGATIGYTTLTYGSGGGYPYTTGKIPYLFGEYKLVNDMSGVQSYPISNTDNSFAGAPLEENFAYLKYAKDQMPEAKPVIANIQAFAWGGGGRYPTEVETRNMVYAALVNRLEGIAAYAFNEESGKLDTDRPALWTEWKKLRSDINGRFLQAILDGSYKYFVTPNVAFGKPKIHAATFKYFDVTDSKTYVYAIVINTNSSSSLATTDLIELPASPAGYTIAPLFANDSRYSKSLSLVEKSGKFYLNGTIPASGVEVYVLTAK